MNLYHELAAYWFHYAPNMANQCEFSHQHSTPFSVFAPTVFVCVYLAAFLQTSERCMDAFDEGQPFVVDLPNSRALYIQGDTRKETSAWYTAFSKATTVSPNDCTGYGWTWIWVSLCQGQRAVWSSRAVSLYITVWTWSGNIFHFLGTQDSNALCLLANKYIVVVTCIIQYMIELMCTGEWWSSDGPAAHSGWRAPHCGEVHQLCGHSRWETDLTNTAWAYWETCKNFVCWGRDTSRSDYTMLFVKYILTGFSMR